MLLLLYFVFYSGRSCRTLEDWIRAPLPFLHVGLGPDAATAGRRTLTRRCRRRMSFGHARAAAAALWTRFWGLSRLRFRQSRWRPTTLTLEHVPSRFRFFLYLLVCINSPLANLAGDGGWRYSTSHSCGETLKD